MANIRYLSICSELVQAERTFVSTQRMMHTFKPLFRGLVSQEEFSCLFPEELIQLLSVHTKFLSSLTTIVESNSCRDVGQWFLDAIGAHKHEMLAGCRTCLLNYPAMREILAKHAGSRALKGIARQCAAGVNGRDTSLGSSLLVILSAPVRHLFRYRLLLNELVLIGGIAEVEDANLRPALEAVEALLDDINRPEVEEESLPGEDHSSKSAQTATGRRDERRRFSLSFGSMKTEPIRMIKNPFKKLGKAIHKNMKK